MSADASDVKEPTATLPSEVAVIGIGCRFPGATCLKEFWGVLLKGENHITEFPPERWVADDFFDTDPDAVGCSYTKKAGFIQNFADFDHKLFGVNETEAAQMDPQQRQVLECTFMALENAGITRQEIAGQRVGVYIGSMNTDYNLRVVHCPEVVDQYSVSGQASSVISNRVSYLFNLTGPSMTIDTACSSSIVAIHQAILGLRAGDCSMAICGGVSLILHPQVFTPLCKAQMLSKTGQCHAFSNDADGYTRGEGCGIVILKLAEKASADGDNVWGTIVTGLNQDGRFAQPITAPSGKQQEELLHDVFRTNHIDPGTVQYIEAHGTGTRLGDPVEVGAFASFFSKSSAPRQRYIGSVKTNIGHLEPAAGVAGLIKVLLMMKHNIIVPSLHCERPNELIDFDKLQLSVPSKCVPWLDDVKVVCLNSFGFGGANSHAVIKSVSNASKLASSTNKCMQHIVCFSGSTFKTLCKSIFDFLSESDVLDIESLSYTSTARREHFKFRKAWVSDTIDNLKKQIQKFTDDQQNTEKSLGARRGVIFVFCGMGTAWQGMCKDLMKTNPSTRETMTCIDKSLKRFVSWSLIQKFEDSDDVKDPTFGPIAIFACQVTLARLWESWGVIPEAVVGQSIGEVAAAHIAGILPLDEAVRVIYHRTEIMSKATGGKMVMVRNLNTTVVDKLCDGYKDKVNVALYYSPVSCTISGDCESVDTLKEDIAKTSRDNADVQLIHLDVTSAFHSYHMDICQQQLDTVLHDLRTEKVTIPMVSSVDPQYGNDCLVSPKYWGQNLRQPVRFHEAITTAAKEESKLFLEIGPNPILRAHMKDIFSNGIQPLTVSSMRRNDQGQDILKSVVSLYENGINIKWDAWNTRCLSLASTPRHSFDHKKLWKLGALDRERASGCKAGRQDHLFVKNTSQPSECKLSIKPTDFSTVYEHKVKGIIVVPGATYGEAGFAVTKLLNLGNPFIAKISVRFFSPVTLKKATQTDLDIEVENVSTHEATYTIKKGDEVHAQGTIITSKGFYGEDRVDLDAIKGRCQQHISGRDVYKMLEQSGFTYGESFATIDHGFKGEGESLAVLKLPRRLQTEMKRTLFHPAVLDGMLQAPTVTYFQHGEFFPIELADIMLLRPLQNEMLVYTKLTHVSGPRSSFCLSLMSEDGTILAKIRKFSTKLIGIEIFDEKTATYQKTWREVNLTKTVTVDMAKVVVFTNLPMTGIDMQCSFVDLSKVTVAMISTLEIVHHDIEHIYFVLEIPDASPSGQDLLDEVTKRVMALRLMILYLTNKDLHIPLTVIMEARMFKDSRSIEAASLCLNEAVNGFCRCVLREYKELQLKTVEITAADQESFISQIPEAMYLPIAEENDLSEIKLQDGVVHTFELESCVKETPLYRNGNLTDSAILCSKVNNALVKPSFFLQKATHCNKMRDETEFHINTAVIHDSSLHRNTDQSNSKFGTAESQAYPMLSLEFIGKIKSKSKSDGMLAFYPANIQKVIDIPTKCILPIKYFPYYQPGYMIVFYTLWCMDNITKGTSVAILYVQKTKALAKSLLVLLQRNSRMHMTLLTPDEIVEASPHKTLITTVLLTTDVAKTLTEKWDKLERIVCLENITNRNIIESLASCNWMNVRLLRPMEMFSPLAMSKAVPKMFHWIKANSKRMKELATLFKQCEFLQLEEGVKPINLTEILKTSVVDIGDGERCSLNHMKISSELLIRKTRSYLVVGGLTGLGWECVKYLTLKGAGCVVILSRSKPGKEQENEMRQLENESGCNVRSVQTDATDYEILNKTISEQQAEFSKMPLGGVIYSAAVLRDASLLELTEGKLRSSLSPKVCGAWNLHVLTAGLPLDFFVFHSSGTSVLGNAGQSNYGAGNGFMDELAHCRRRDGLAGQSINWGPLGLGMLHNNHVAMKRLQNQGFELIEKKDINQCLTHLLMLNEPQSVMIRIDRRKMADQLMKNKERSLLARLQTFLEPVMRNVQDRAMDTEQQKFSIEELRACNHEDALRMLQMYIKKLASDKALLDEEQFDMTMEMKDQGVDSMCAMEITGEIMSDLGVKLSVQEIQLQSALTLTQSIVDKLFKEEQNTPGTVDNELIVSRYTIIKSIAESMFGFHTEREFTMGFVLVCTVQIPDLVDADYMSKLLKECISKHKLARSTCTLTTNSFSQMELSVDEAFDFRVVSGADISEVDKIKNEPLNVKTQGPLRFIFPTGTKQLIIVFHKFFFDIRAVTLFVGDILSVAERNTASVAQDAETREDADTAYEIQRVLAPQFQGLLEFWKARIASIPHSSFCHLSTLESQTVEHVLVTKTLSSDIYNKIIQFTREQKITVFEYCVSIYQLYLSFFANKLTSVVTTSVDTRSSVPTLARSLGRCTNLIPLVCQLADDSAVVSEFLQRNKTDIQKFIQSGIFPFLEMTKLVDEDRVQSLSRNFFIFEDDTLTNEHNQLQVEQAVEFSSHTETYLYLWQKRLTKTLDLRFHLNRNLYNTTKGIAILDGYVDLLTQTFTHPEATMKFFKRKHISARDTKSPTGTSHSKCFVM